MALRLKFVATPKQLSERDAHTIRVLQEQSFEKVYMPIPDMTDAYWWIAYDGKIPVGFCGMSTWEGIDAAFLCLAGVIPGARGRGLQRRMIRAREKRAQQIETVTRTVSYTSRDNVISANNLIKCGYLLYIPGWDWGVEDAYYFQKKLKKPQPKLGLEPIELQPSLTPNIAVP